MTPPRYELVVPPLQVVAHAASYFSADPDARVRFRAHFDPCCFFIELYEPRDPNSIQPHLPVRSVLVLAWRDRDGARLQIPSPREVSSKALAVFAALVFAPLTLFHHPLWLLASAVLFLALDSVRETAADRQRRQQLDAEIFAALDHVFAPIRRPTGLPYREPAALPPPSPRLPRKDRPAADNAPTT